MPQDTLDFIASIEEFAHTITSLLPTAAFLAVVMSFMMLAYFAIRVAAK